MTTIVHTPKCVPKLPEIAPPKREVTDFFEFAYGFKKIVHCLCIIYFSKLC